MVHLWVEGFFEVFATNIFMAGPVLGTLHHLYFAGTPTAVLALGASFSALEVVPLAYLGFEAYHTYGLSRATPWMARYKWPLSVGAVAFTWLVIRLWIQPRRDEALPAASQAAER